MIYIFYLSEKQRDTSLLSELFLVGKTRLSLNEMEVFLILLKDGLQSNLNRKSFPLKIIFTYDIVIVSKLLYATRSEFV